MSEENKVCMSGVSRGTFFQNGLLVLRWVKRLVGFPPGNAYMQASIHTYYLRLSCTCSNFSGKENHGKALLRTLLYTCG